MKTKELTQEYLKTILDYNPNTGIFTWKSHHRHNVKIGSVAGGINNHSRFVMIKVNGNRYQAHLLAWIYVYGRKPYFKITHKNHIKHDNRIENLELIDTATKNIKMKITNTSGINGVSWNKHSCKWHAYGVNRNKKRVHLGVFENLEDAAKAREEFNEQHGYHENHGKSI